jgi:hypothetical protein
VDLAAEAQALADQITAGGLRAVIDARDVNPPCALIRPPVLGYRFGGCNRLTWTIYVLTPDAGTRGALTVLGDDVEKVQAALGYPAAEVTPVDVALPDGGTVPGYSLTLITRPMP